MVDKFQEFYLQRNVDESGISGTGVVCRGVIFPSGKVIMEWQTFHSSLGFYANISDVETLHGHDGNTLVIMGTPPAPKKLTVAKKNGKEQKAV